MVTLMAGLAACEPEKPPEGNGNLKALYIKSPAYFVAASLWTRVEIPNRRVFLPEGERPNAPLQEDTWDFEGTTLEINSPPGFAFEVSSVTSTDPSPEAQDFRTRNEAGGGFIIRVHCDGVPNVPHQVWLWVRHGETVRYHDSFDITCHRASRMEVEGLANGRYFVGGRALVDVTLTTASTLGQTRIWGENLMVTDRSGLLRVEPFLSNPYRQVMLMQVVTPGTGPELAFQNLTYKPAIEAVVDEGWTVELGPAQPLPDSPNGQLWQLPVKARGSDGGELKGLYGCTWDITLQEGPTYQESGCQPTVRTGAPARACVTVEGRRACRDYI
jgi:hypothetical protein